VARRCQEQPATGNENAMNFGEHALRRKRVMLYHVCVGREVERIVCEWQRLEAEIALAIIHAAIRDGFVKRFCVHSVIHGRGAPAEPRPVNRERAELRANVEQPWRLIFGSVGQDVAQDSNLSPAVAQRIANPIREIRRNPRVARDCLEHVLEAFERGKLALHYISTGVSIGEFHADDILHYRFSASIQRLMGYAAVSAITRALNQNLGFGRLAFCMPRKRTLDKLHALAALKFAPL